jgi:putative transposase
MKRQRTSINEPCQTYFLTSTVTRFTNIFHHREPADIVLANINFYLKQFKASLHAFVIMPNHIHLLLTMGENGTVSQFMGRIKEYSAKQIIEWCKRNACKEMLTKFAGSAAQYRPEHHYQVWQARFDDLLIRTEKQYLIKAEYIHNNPLQERWQLASAPEEYPLSSARFYLRGDDAGIPIVRHPWAGDWHGISAV